MNILQYMQTDLVCLQADEPLINAVEAASSERIRHLPILEGERLVGIVSDRDIKQACPSALIEDGEAEYDHILRDTPVRRIMRAWPVTIGPDTTFAESVRLMLDHRIGALPVVDGGKLLGLVTHADMLRAFLDSLMRG